MEEKELRALLDLVKSGGLDVDQALLKIRTRPFDDLGYAKVDLQRGVRTGMAEVIFGQGKTPEQIVGIAKSMLENGQKRVLITRLDADKEAKVRKLLGISAAEETKARKLPGISAAEGTSASAAHENIGGIQDADGARASAEEATSDGARASASAEITGELLYGEGRFPYRYGKDGRIALIGDMPRPDGIGKILVITAGTSDIPVAEEAAFTGEVFGNEVVRVYDAGVAGLHRLLAHLDDIMGATVIIAIAGMEGALPAVVTGLADCPVIAVPTSVGYGTSFHGMSALLSMLNCCASGMCVENIDNGFGAAYFGSMINHLKGYSRG